MNASPATDTHQLTAPLILWRAAEAFMRMLHALFGNPSDVAATYTLTLKAHQVMASWLRCGEAMMRRLLLIEAQHFAKPNLRPFLREPRQRTRKLRLFTPDAPEKWRVSFRCFNRPPQRGGSAELCEAKGEVAPSVACGSPSPARGGDMPRPFIYREHPAPPCPPRPNTKRTNRQRYAPILRQEREWRLHEEPLIFRSAWPLAERYEALLRAFNNPLPYAQRLSRKLHATPHRARELLSRPPDAHDRIDNFTELTAAASASAAVFNTS